PFGPSLCSDGGDGHPSAAPARWAAAPQLPAARLRHDASASCRAGARRRRTRPRDAGGAGAGDGVAVGPGASAGATAPAGQRSRALSKGYVSISEVESTMRLNASLEENNSQLEAEIAECLRLNLQLRDNIVRMEAMLGIEAAVEPRTSSERGDACEGVGSEGDDVGSDVGSDDDGASPR
ncbi:unnamed protein product, partial [Prorocentrum cordatum]